MPTGRPAKYKTPQELQERIDAYKASEPDKPTKSGLALFLGFDDKDTMMTYCWRKVDKHLFEGIIKNALTWIETHHEARMYGNGCAGSIFWLKNHGWADNHGIMFDGQIDIPASPQRPAIEQALSDSEPAICDG